ncbi:MAG: EAL domain-containing protein [Acidobacteria bacterium]|nr:EAL domain-containing protein [Acidobacteriota bacterium]
MLRKTQWPDHRIQIGLIACLGLLHAIVVLALPHPLISSNLIQIAAPLIAVVMCIHHGRATQERYYRHAWFMMGLAFGLWVWAQADYLWTLVRHHSTGSFPGFTDFLWLSFCFPIFLLASRAGEKDQHDVALAMDLLQAGLSVVILFGIMYFHPAGLSDSIAYDIQGLGLLLVVTLALSNCRVPGERIFFRDVAWFCLVNVLLTGAGVLAQDYGSPLGGITDLSWSYPVLFFCAIAVGLPDRMARADKKKVPVRASLVHMHGISSVGLTLTSFAGAAALLQHELSWGILCFVLSGMIFAARAVAREAQFRRTHARLLHTALHDELTGLANRRLIADEVESLAQDTQTTRALLLIDLDRFKMINDSMGHTMGDSLLIQVAERIRTSLRTEDIVARFGGDEFVVLLHGPQTQQSAEQVAGHLVSALRKPILLGARWITTTASIGVVTFTGGEDVSGLLRSGDLAMYRAKSLGKNRHYLFEPSLLSTAIRESEIEAALRRAVHDGDIYLEYQPICDVRNGSVACFEVLARWTDEALGPVLPSEFIPIAESTRLITELGRHILQMACSQVAAWNREYHGSLRVSVNVSTVQILDQSFVAMLREILNAEQCSSSVLWLEVTESVLMVDRARAHEVFLELREMGVTMCLDDFGTGFSSLSYLTTFPFDIVKLDRSFIRDIENDEKRGQMVAAIVRLAAILNKQVVVEGVETQTEFDQVVPSGCAYAQGFFYARPLTPEKIDMLMLSSGGAVKIY